MSKKYLLSKPTYFTLKNENEANINIIIYNYENNIIITGTCLYCTCENIMVVPNINISIYHNFKKLASTYTNCCGNYSFIVPKFKEYTIILKKDCNCIKHDLKVINNEFIYVKNFIWEQKKLDK